MTSVPETASPIKPLGFNESEITFDRPCVTHRSRISVTRFTLTEVPCQLDGRGFVVAGEGWRDVVFDVFVSQRSPDHFCTCEVCNNFGTCCHLESVLNLIDAGEFDRVMAANPEQPWPSPEQLAAEAGVELPF